MDARHCSWPENSMNILFISHRYSWSMLEVQISYIQHISKEISYRFAYQTGKGP